MTTPTKDQALKAFIDCIECNGGCMKDRKGYVVPKADEEWLDLGNAYLAACAALGREPMIEED